MLNFFVKVIFILIYRLWDIECGVCLRVLEGHEELVRCIRFDAKRIVSGAYDGKIKVWDLVAALDPRAPTSSLCLRTLVVSFLKYRPSTLVVDESQDLPVPPVIFAKVNN